MKKKQRGFNQDQKIHQLFNAIFIVENAKNRPTIKQNFFFSLFRKYKSI